MSNAKDMFSESVDKLEWFKTGIPGFDDLISKGIPVGSSILIEGGPGSGKTIFCLQIAYNACKRGKKVLYMSFEEPERRLKHHMSEFGWDAKKFEDKGLFKIQRFNALDIARSVEALLSEAKRELLIEIQPVLIPADYNPEIIIVDSISSIASAFSGAESRFRIYMEQFFRYLEKQKITSFLIREIAHPTHLGLVYTEKGEAISFLADGIIALYSILYRQGKRRSGIEIIKMRGTEIKKKIVEMRIISKKGIVVYPESIIGEGIKSALAFT